MKNQKGITLIALVITIIVLLILAGVAIAMLSGDNGILNRASKASTESAFGTAKDEIYVLCTEALTDYYEATYVGDTTVPYSNNALDKAVYEKINAASTTNGGFADKKIAISWTEVTEAAGEEAGTYTGGVIELEHDDGSTLTGTLSAGKITWAEAGVTGPASRE